MVTSEGRVFSLSFVSLLPCPLLSIHPLMGFRGSPELVTNVYNGPEVVDPCIPLLLRPLFIRPGALRENTVGKGKGDEGTGLIALYTHLRVSLDLLPASNSK